MTIALCCNTSFGMVNFRGGVIRALVAQGHRVVVIAPRDAYAERFASMGSEYVEWNLSGRSTRLAHEFQALRQLTAILHEVRPELTFNFTIKAVIYGAIASHRLGIPFISIITGLGYVFLNENWISKLSRVLYRFTLKRAREVWFLNEDDRRLFERLGLADPSRVRILPSEGIDLTHFAPTPLPTRQRDKDIVFLMVARLLTDKGIYELIEAARLIRARHPGIQVRLLGPVDTGNPTAIAQAQIDTWCAEGVIDYLGTRKDVRPCIADADAVLLPSYREGLPRSLLEAAAMGRPIIATDVPGCRDVVIDGESGFLCRVRDAADLAARMETFLALTPAQRNAMGQRGRQLVEQRYDERHVIAKYVQVIEDARPPVT